MNFLEIVPIQDAVFPLWIKIAYTVFVIILIPIYWKNWGVANFLWFSDIALFGTLVALWLESSLVASMMGVAVLFPEIAWNVSYFTRLITGKIFSASLTICLIIPNLCFSALFLFFMLLFRF